jgi:hypothetical protein
VKTIDGWQARLDDVVTRHPRLAVAVAVPCRFGAERGANLAAGTGAKPRLRSQPLGDPSAPGAPVADPVVQAVGAVHPELEHLGGEPEAAPERG